PENHSSLGTSIGPAASSRSRFLSVRLRDRHAERPARSAPGRPERELVTQTLPTEVAPSAGDQLSGAPTNRLCSTAADRALTGSVLVAQWPVSAMVRIRPLG